jgi:hypothetical protein
MIYVFHNPKTEYNCPNPEHVYCMTVTELAAEVDTNCLEEALEWTGSTMWEYKIPKVKYFNACRPTLIGDFLVDQMGGWWQVTSTNLNRLQLHWGKECIDNERRTKG